ncbi:hypothetical protein BDD12DRAFT_979052 [Trichophaea hybrida]|nr:hypothetical protein BDD12DRAFT_979052 [Trichophaea hybrida]
MSWRRNHPIQAAPIFQRSKIIRSDIPKGAQQNSNPPRSLWGVSNSPNWWTKHLVTLGLFTSSPFPYSSEHLARPDTFTVWGGGKEWNVAVSPLSSSSCGEILGRHKCIYQPGEGFPPHPTSGDSSNSNSELSHNWDDLYDLNRDARTVSSAAIEQPREGPGDVVGFEDVCDGFSTSGYLQELLPNPVLGPADADYDLTSPDAALGFWGFDDPSIPFEIYIPSQPIFPNHTGAHTRNTTFSPASPYGVSDLTGTSVAFRDDCPPIHYPSVGPIRRPRKRNRTDIQSRYTCERCGESFTTITNYNRHNSTSKCSTENGRVAPSNPTRYMCGIDSCPKGYNRKDNRDKHQREKHGLRSGRLTTEEERIVSPGPFGIYNGLMVIHVRMLNDDIISKLDKVDRSLDPDETSDDK